MTPRRENDFYPTPDGALKVLLKYLHLRKGAWIYEPCVGTGNLSNILAARQYKVYTNDIDQDMEAHEYIDASKRWPMVYTEEQWYHRNFDWVITNPPFNNAMEILQTTIANAEKSAIKGVSFLLRLSFLEPTNDRGKFLSKHPPSQVLILPRMSFTGDGKTDSVTCAWMTWDLPLAEDPKDLFQELRIISKPELEQAQNEPDKGEGEQPDKGDGNPNQQGGSGNGDGQPKEGEGNGNGKGDGQEGQDGNGNGKGGQPAEPPPDRNDRTAEKWREHLSEFEGKFDNYFG